MKKLTISFLLIFTIFNLQANTHDVADDLNKCVSIYNVEINKLNSLLYDFNLWITTMDGSEEQRMKDGKTKTKNISNQLSNSVTAMNEMPMIDGNYSFRDTAKFVFSELKKNNEGNEMLLVLSYDDTKDVEALKSYYRAYKKVKKNK